MNLAEIFHPHDPVLVGLTLILATFAAFVSLELAARMKAADGQARFAWLSAAALTMGGGIWAMQFIGMLALQLPFAVAYDPLLTLDSFIIAVLAAMTGLYGVFWYQGAAWRCWAGGLMMGLGMGAMHYTGMAAMITLAVTVYDPLLVTLSIAVAVAASVVGLWLAYRVEGLLVRLGAAVLMGVAVVGMHLTGMAAARFVCDAHDVLPAGRPALSADWLAVAVSGASFGILMMGLVLAVLDRRAKKRAWAAMLARESERRINALLRSAADLIAIIGQDWRIIYLSPGGARMLEGRELLAFFEPEGQLRAQGLMVLALAHPGEPVHGEFRSGADPELWFELNLNAQCDDPAIQGVIVNLHEITQHKRATAAMAQALEQAREAAAQAERHAEELERAHAATKAAEDYAQELEKAHAARRAAEEQATMLARHDALTGLPNRRVLTADLQTALIRARAGAGYCSVLLIDLDGFKKVNELHGHHVGDGLLCEVARRLQETIRKNDVVARLGGDEFAIIAEGENDLNMHQEGAMRLARRVLSAIREPIASSGGMIEICASVGVALCRADAADTGQVLRAADIAMHRAKETGRGSYRFFEQRMDDEMREKEALERELTAAITAEEIRPYFQPLVELGSRRVHGFEALARWQHPVRGFIPPDVFIPIAEQLGLMTRLTNSILSQACREARQWPADVMVAVNFSPSELKDPMLPSRILSILEHEDLPPGRLEVEITETAVVSNIEAARAALATLQGFGVVVCLDDFGTGYSSLSHLQALKFDKVKIDRSFIQGMQVSADSEKIVDAILGLTRSLKLPAVAEGIENEAVLAVLAMKGCEVGQGFYFGKAMTGAEAREMVGRGTRRRLVLV